MTLDKSLSVPLDDRFRYTTALNDALKLISVKTPKCIIFQRNNVWASPLRPDQYDWEKLLNKAKPHPCVPVEANDSLYILYTSGTTGNYSIFNNRMNKDRSQLESIVPIGHPKGILRPIGGHLATLCWSMKTIYGINKNSVWWSASDMGWVVGHSYICYGPLIYGATTVMYEGKPDRTPDASQYFRSIRPFTNFYKAHPKFNPLITYNVSFLQNNRSA